MNRNILLILLLLLSLGAATAQDNSVSGTIKDEQGKPIELANVYWLGTTRLTFSNEDGSFSIDRATGSDRLVVSFTGFQIDTIAVPADIHSLSVQLRPIMMDEVNVIGTSRGRRKPQLDVKNSELLNRNELFKAACCSLGESFTSNPSVDVSTTDAATGSAQIKLLGLSGKYVQMLTENIPNLRGVAAPYALGYIPGSWMESVQISKGAASVKNGYESMTGQINIEYRKPNIPRYLEGNLYVDNHLMTEVNLAGNYSFTPHWSTALLTHFSTDLMEMDGNGDAFLDRPKTRQYNVLNRWMYLTDHFQTQIGGRFLHEQLDGGQTSRLQLPNPYKIGITSQRGEIFGKMSTILNHDTGANAALLMQGTLQDFDARYGYKNFKEREYSFYGSLVYESVFAHLHQISTGVSWTFDHYDRLYNLQQVDQAPRQDERLYESVPGVYAQYTFNHHNEFVVMAGLRADYSSQHGLFFTPRAHIKYQPHSIIALRFSAGKGYRSHHPLSENNYLLASSRQMILPTESLKQEEAWNFGFSTSLDIPIGSKKLEVNAEYYYTLFMNRVVIDLNRDPHAVYFYNLTGRSFSHTAQIDATISPIRNLDITAAFRYNDVRTTYGDQLMREPLTSRFKGLLTASYKTPLRRWQFDTTLQINGGGSMPTSYKLPDGTDSWGQTFPTYPILNAQITRYFPKWSIFLGGENLTNFSQPNPVVGADNPWGANFDSNVVWGPVEGYKVYLGVRFNIFD